MTERKNGLPDADNQGRDDYFMDVDRMMNEGLGGGFVTRNNALIDDTTTDTMEQQESVLNEPAKAETDETAL